MQAFEERPSIWHLRFCVRLALSFLPSAGLVVAVFLLLGHDSLVTIRTSADADGWFTISQAQVLITQQINVAQADALVTAGSPVLSRWADDSSQTKDVVSVLHELCLRKPQYAQIRLLDLNGHEVVRVDDLAGGRRVVPPEDLQDKSSRYYFIEARDLKAGQVYVSKLDLNVEHGAIVQPWQPTIRLVTPVIDSDRVVKGFIILNYNAGELFKRIDQLAKSKHGDLHVLNSDGFWLASPNAEDEWGFMFPDRMERNVGVRYPAIWEIVKANKTGSEELDLGRFRWLTVPSVNATDAKQPHGEAPRTLILMSFTDAEELALMRREAYMPYVSVCLLALLVVFAGCFGITYYWNRIDQANKQKQVLVAALQNSPCGVLVTYRNGEIYWVNDPFCSMLGFAPEELIGKTPDCLVAEESREVSLSAFGSDVDRHGQWQTEVVLQAKDGATSTHSIIASPAELSGDRSRQLYLMVALDISKQKSTEQAYDLARQRADDANRAKSVFLSNMSHEIRTPLNVILGFAQLLQLDTSLAARQREQVELISSDGRHLLALINDVLEMARIESGRIVLEESDTDPRALILSLAGMFKQRAEGQGLIFETMVDEAVPSVIVIDSRKFRQVMINLIGNALKFTRQGSIKVHMRLVNTDSDGLCCLHTSVEDTGVGISEADIERLFHPFEQVAAEQGESNEGTGLGLAICQRYAAVMDGRIEVDSVRGQGSRFGLILPLVIADGDATNLIDIHEILYRLPADHPPVHVLVVDDKESNRKLVSSVLEAKGIDVRTAQNGAEGLQIAKEWKPDLIFMDLVMPVLDGFEAIRRIRKDPTICETPIVALTASVFGVEFSNHVQIGVERIIRKPFLISELRDAIQDLLGIKMVPKETSTSVKGEGIVVPVSLRSSDDASGTHVRPATQRKSVVAQGPLSTEMRGAITEAALALDSDALEALIDVLRTTNPELAMSLTEWVELFDFDAIVTCMKTVEAVDE